MKIYVDGKVGRKSEYKSMSNSTFWKLTQQPDVTMIYDEVDILYQVTYKVYIEGSYVYGCDSYEQCYNLFCDEEYVEIKKCISGWAVYEPQEITVYKWCY